MRQSGQISTLDQPSPSIVNVGVLRWQVVHSFAMSVMRTTTGLSVPSLSEISIAEL